MENIEISKAAAIDKLPGRFLKDGNEILSKPVSEICNPSVSHWIFPNPCEVEKISLILKKDKKGLPMKLQVTDYSSLVTATDFKNHWKSISHPDKWISLKQ